MTAPDPQPGQRWLVTRTGVIVPAIRLRPGFVRLRLDAPAGEFMPLATMSLRLGDWERLPDPEPEWAPGDLVIDAKGYVWRRWIAAPGAVSGEPLVWGLSTDCRPYAPDREPTRPLRRLVPEV